MPHQLPIAQPHTPEGSGYPGEGFALSQCAGVAAYGGANAEPGLLCRRSNISTCWFRQHEVYGYKKPVLFCPARPQKGSHFKWTKRYEIRTIIINLYDKHQFFTSPSF